jgi:F1F0 ATPase subunit 2
MTPATSVLAVCFLGGLAVGAFFFGGLYWTVSELPQSRHPIGLMITSFVLRFGATAAFFYALGADQWQRCLATLAGVVTVKVALLTRIALRAKKNAL